MSAAQDGSGRKPEPVELPAPTAWPMIAAFGVTFSLAGLVTHLAVSIVGVVVGLIAAVGWWREVLPMEQVEHVPLRPPAERARPIVPSPAAVEALIAGEARHRVRVREALSAGEPLNPEVIEKVRQAWGTTIRVSWRR